eukprot:CAMPEP_0194513438 /NCGR_PEP_ID=MMETSP0253-20130528/45700_1 /TAXON_ID=2966 /ORGANISM="Noctiluca scintillans" /LENGTH=139 /DNA_ID=CAMNT_0039356991 /DNA_START=35 /DNA_END=454 /DNA_ORIENTATION=+
MSVNLSGCLGARATCEQVATPELSAREMGSGDLLVYATPALVALMEGAAVRALAGFLPEGWTTVGTGISTSHLAATPMGVAVTAEAEVVEASGRSASFKVVARDGSGDVVGEGTHTRVAVDASKFMMKCSEKAPTPSTL